MARRAFGNDIDPEAQQEDARKFYRAQKKAIQIDQQKTIAAIVFENGDETEPFLSSYNASLPFLHVTKSSDPSLALQIIFKMTALCYLHQLNLDKM